MFFIIEWAYKQEYINYAYYKLSLDLLNKYGFKPLSKEYPIQTLIDLMKIL